MGQISSWECSHIDGTFLPTSTDTAYFEKAMLEKLIKWTDNRVYKSVDYYNHQKPILLQWIYSSKIVNGNKKTKAGLAAKGYQEGNNIKSDFLSCTKKS